MNLEIWKETSLKQFSLTLKTIFFRKSSAEMCQVGPIFRLTKLRKRTSVELQENFFFFNSNCVFVIFRFLVSKNVIACETFFPVREFSISMWG